MELKQVSLNIWGQPKYLMSSKCLVWLSQNVRSTWKWGGMERGCREWHVWLPTFPLLQLQLPSRKRLARSTPGIYLVEFLRIICKLNAFTKLCWTTPNKEQPRYWGRETIDSKFWIWKKNFSELGFPIFGYSIWRNIAEFGIVCDTPI